MAYLKFYREHYKYNRIQALILVEFEIIGFCFSIWELIALQPTPKIGHGSYKHISYTRFRLANYDRQPSSICRRTKLRKRNVKWVAALKQ